MRIDRPAGRRPRAVAALGLAAAVILGAACGSAADRAAKLSPSEARIAAGSVTWVQHSDAGPELRMVADSNHCPKVVRNGVAVATTERMLVDPAFPVAVCSVPVAPGDEVEHGPHRHEVPRRIDRVAVLADPACPPTRCETRSFAELAAAVAATNPALVVIAGDLLADSEVCFERPGCRTPWDDRWATWKLRFLEPAAPILETAPVVFVRGAAHGCDGRMYEGWGHLVAPGAYPPDVECRPRDPAVAVDLDGAPRLVAADVTNGSSPRPGASGAPAWLVTGGDPSSSTAVFDAGRAAVVMRPSSSPRYVADRGDGTAELHLGPATGADASFWLLERRDGCWRAELRRAGRVATDHEPAACLPS